MIRTGVPGGVAAGNRSRSGRPARLVQRLVMIDGETAGCAPVATVKGE